MRTRIQVRALPGLAACPPHSSLQRWALALMLLRWVHRGTPEETLALLGTALCSFLFPLTQCFRGNLSFANGELAAR